MVHLSIPSLLSDLVCTPVYLFVAQNSGTFSGRSNVTDRLNDCITMFDHAFSCFIVNFQGEILESYHSQPHCVQSARCRSCPTVKFIY
jgi:hypothetical protein